MKAIVCGGRDYKDRDFFFATMDAIHQNLKLTAIIEGGASGADELALEWSRERGIPEHARYTADWSAHGRSAGPIRNMQMLSEERPDLVIAFPGGRGTAHMVRIARDAGVKVFEIS